MARRGFRGRRRAGNLAKKRFAWTRAIFETGLDITDVGDQPDANGLVLFDALTDVVGGSTDYNRKYNVRRVIVKGQYILTPSLSAFATVSVKCVESLFVIDNDDTDASLVTTAQGDILEGGADRVLYTNAWGCQAYEQSVVDGQVNSELVFGPRIDVDWRGNAKCGLEQLVTFGMQFMNDLTGVLSGVQLVVVSSVLFEIT